MVDLHCHILPGIDDGAQTIEDSLAMAEDAIQDGITCVVATPHASTEYQFDYKKVRAVRDELQSRLDGRLTIATGCDFHLNPENFQELKKDSAPFCINQKDYLLVEFNEFSIPPAMDQTLHELHLMGCGRLSRIRSATESCALNRSGCGAGCDWDVTRRWTAGSLTGVFGPGPQEDAWTWIDQGLFILCQAMATTRRDGP